MSTPDSADNNPYTQPAGGNNNPYGGPQQPYGDAQPQPYAGGQPPYVNSQPGFNAYEQPFVDGQPYSTPGQAPYSGYGQPQYQMNPAGSKSKVVAGILGILLGSLGIHNFYLGHTGKAVVQLILTLLVFTSFISAVWGLVEGILILVSKPGDKWHRDARGFELQD